MTTRLAPGEALECVFAEIRAEHDRWRKLMAALSADDAGLRLADKWSAVETLAHVAAWKENALRIAHDQAQSASPDPGSTRGPAGVLHIYVQAFNEAVSEQWRGAEVAKALSWAESVHDELMDALAVLPAVRLLGGRGRYGARPWYWMPAVAHSAGHRRRLVGRLRGIGVALPEFDEPRRG